MLKDDPGQYEREREVDHLLNSILLSLSVCKQLFSTHAELSVTFSGHEHLKYSHIALLDHVN